MDTAPKPVIVLRISAVERRVGLNRTAIYKGIRDGWFPKPVKFGMSSRWLESEIDALIAEAKACRDKART